MEENILVQLSYPFGSKAFPIKVDDLPDSIKSALTMDDIYPLLSYTEKRKLCDTSVAYFRQVKKFRKDVQTTEEHNGITYGI